jgi:hypothetical protein
MPQPIVCLPNVSSKLSLAPGGQGAIARASGSGASCPDSIAIYTPPAPRPDTSKAWQMEAWPPGLRAKLNRDSAARNWGGCDCIRTRFEAFRPGRKVIVTLSPSFDLMCALGGDLREAQPNKWATSLSSPGKFRLAFFQKCAHSFLMIGCLEQLR